MNTQHKRVTKTIIMLGIALLLLNSIQVAAVESMPEQIVLTTSRSEGDPGAKWVILIITEALHRLDRELIYTQYPLKRGNMLANEGTIDGLMGRDEKFGTLYPNLIRVEEPMIFVKFSAFATDPTIQVAGWESLRGSTYRIEYRRGFEIAETHLAHLVDPENISLINDWTAGLKKLMGKRTDIFIELERTIMRELQTDAFKDSGIRNAGVLHEIPFYLYMHKKHQDLASKLAAVLKQMREEGLIEKYEAMAYGE